MKTCGYGDWTKDPTLAGDFLHGNHGTRFICSVSLPYDTVVRGAASVCSAKHLLQNKKLQPVTASEKAGVAGAEQ